jgi:TolB-like protein/class 3 adenylate cyclase/Flp pilus assembly protein TadD
MKSKRKLTAIMFTDIVSYTAMSEKNEQFALAVLAQNRLLHNTIILKHLGKKLKEIGDGTLAVFDSAIDAALCAIEIQKKVCQSTKYQLRIGLHIGDVLACSNDILGNSVNVAARIQGASKPETIATSESFYNAISGQSDFPINFLANIQLKGVSIPVNIYEIIFSNTDLITTEDSSYSGLFDSYKHYLTRNFYLTITAILLGCVIFIGQGFIEDKSVNSSQTFIENSVSSIAVLPFKDFSAAHDQEYFGDGIAEELLNLLAKIERLNVASRTSSFALKNSLEDIQSIGRKLNVSHVLEGSIRRSEQTIRITAQLIKTVDGFHLWSETYDRDIHDVFSIQDEIATAVVAELAKLLVKEEKPMVALKDKLRHPDSFAVYDIYLQGLSFLHAAKNQKNINLAIQYFTEAIDTESSYALAHAGHCQAQVNRYLLSNSNADIIAATSSCMTALELDPTQTEVHIALGYFHHSTGNMIAAQNAFNKALAIVPNATEALIGLADTYMSSGEGQKAENILLDLNTSQPNSWKPYNELGRMYLLDGRIEEAIPLFEKVINLSTKNASGYANLGFAYYYKNNAIEAIRYFKESLIHHKDADVYSNLGSLYYQQYDFEQAIIMFEKATELSPQRAIYWGNLADAMYFSEHKTKANANYSKAIVLAENALINNPKDVATLSNLALYCARLKKIKMAQNYIEQALSIAPSEINVLYYAAITNFEINQPELAWKLLEQAIQRGYPVALLSAAPEMFLYKKNQRFKVLMNQKQKANI